MLEVVAEGLDHPECVVWNPDGSVMAGGEAGQLYRLDPATGTHVELGSSEGWLLGLALDDAGSVYACDPKAHAVLVFSPSGAYRTVSQGTADRAMVTPNYPAFDRSGRLYVSDSGTWGSDDGCIFVISPDGRTDVWSSDVPHFPNGLAISPDERALYVAESTLPGISRIPIRDDGSAGPAELVAAMPQTVPDGLAFDRDGRLYIGCYRPDAIYLLNDGRLETVAHDVQGTALSAPTNLAFGDADGASLYIASLGRWHVSRLRVDVPGLELHRPRLARAGVQ